MSENVLVWKNVKRKKATEVKFLSTRDNFIKLYKQQTMIED